MAVSVGVFLKKVVGGKEGKILSGLTKLNIWKKLLGFLVEYKQIGIQIRNLYNGGVLWWMKQSSLKELKNMSGS